MWDSIEATEQWIFEQMPQVLQVPPETEGLFATLHKIPVTGGKSRTNPPHQKEDVAAKEAVTKEEAEGEDGNVEEEAEEDVDASTIGLVEVRSMAACGACLAIGLRFAGSANPKAFRLLLTALRGFGKRSDPIFELCLNTTALSIALVMAGTGNLDALREMRRLQGRSAAKNYGSQLAIGMAIGILFLGGGGQTINNSNESLAALLCAVYPLFPSDPEDNQYHLQALRHLYALAAEPRLLEAREIDTGESAYVPIEIKVRDAENPFRAVTPCLLPRHDLIESISVDSPRYWPLRAKQSSITASQTRRLLHVKRKAAHLPYADDPKGVKGILARSFGGYVRALGPEPQNAPQLDTFRDRKSVV